MNDFTLRRANNGGWVLSEGMNDGSLWPIYAFSSTEDLLRALPEMLEKKPAAGFQRGEQYLNKNRAL